MSGSTREGRSWTAMSREHSKILNPAWAYLRGRPVLGKKQKTKTNFIKETHLTPAKTNKQTNKQNPSNGIFWKKSDSFFLIIYLLLRNRERQSMSMGRAERGGDTESEAGSRFCAVSIEPDTGLEPTNHKIMTWDEVGRLTHWDTQVPLFFSFQVKFVESEKKKQNKKRKCPKVQIKMQIQVWSKERSPHGVRQPRLVQDWQEDFCRHLDLPGCVRGLPARAPLQSNRGLTAVVWPWPDLQRIFQKFSWIAFPPGGAWTQGSSLFQK